MHADGTGTYSAYEYIQRTDLLRVDALVRRRPSTTHHDGKRVCRHATAPCCPPPSPSINTQQQQHPDGSANFSRTSFLPIHTVHITHSLADCHEP